MKGYTTGDVARLLGLSPRQVRGLARAGAVEPARGPRHEYLFSFQDLVILRAAGALIEARVPAARVRRALERLRDQLPRGRPLSELRIAAEGDRIVVHDGATTWNPESGQVQLDFTVEELGREVAPFTRQATGPDESFGADEWFELAVDLEAYAPEQAVTAYRRALELDETHADAHVNLGRLLHEAGLPADAEGHYRRALAARPEHGTAAFNLAVALEDLGRDDEAIRFYQRALRLDPAIADAHFNLSRLLERRGDGAAAFRHLRAYRDMRGPGAQRPG